MGAAVTINGSGFGSAQGTSTVTFNGTAVVAVSAWTDTQIRTTVPTGATTGNVVVTVAGVASNGRSFTVSPTPVITSLSQTVGAIGMTVTIAGANFGSTQGSSAVKFNGTTATPTRWSASQIVVTVPNGATTGNVVVHTSGVDTNGVNFTVATLTSIAVTPSTVSVPIKSQQRFVANGTYSDGSTQNLWANATWSASDTSIATIDSAGLVNAPTQGGVTIQATWGSITGSATLTITPQSPFIRVGRLNRGRTDHTATLLLNGQVLLAGGEGGDPSLTPTAELYDPATGNFTLTGNPQTIRVGFTATLLQNGKVLIAGGYRVPPLSWQTLATAELYDPATGTFQYTGSMNSGHYFHAATLLPDGRVLISGGYTLNYDPTHDPVSGYPASEIYDPATGTFTAIGSLITPRYMHTATRLNDGTVLIAGGINASGSVLAAELYNPTTGTFTATASASTSLAVPALLNSGAVLFATGPSPNRVPTLYDPVAHAFTPSGSFNVDRGGNTATRLNDGTVLIVGGLVGTSQTASAELYDPASQTFRAAGATTFPRARHTATLLNDGSVLIARRCSARGAVCACAARADFAARDPCHGHHAGRRATAILRDR